MCGFCNSVSCLPSYVVVYRGRQSMVSYRCKLSNGVTFDALQWPVTWISSVARVCQLQLGFLVFLYLTSRPLSIRDAYAPPTGGTGIDININRPINVHVYGYGGPSTGSEYWIDYISLHFTCINRFRLIIFATCSQQFDKRQHCQHRPILFVCSVFFTGR